MSRALRVYDCSATEHPLATAMNLLRTALLALTTLTLAACGSGSSGTFNNPPVPGTYAGGVYGNLGANAHRFVIREGGSFWILLGSADSSRFSQSGFVVGSNIYTTDYASGTQYDVLNPAGVLVNMNTGQDGPFTTIAGNIQLAGTFANSTFDGRNYSPTGFSTDGLWSASDAAGRPINLSFSGGQFFASTTTAGQLRCDFSGRLDATVLQGFYDVIVNDQTGCLGPAFATYTGIALTETPPSGFGQQLMIAAVGNGRGISLSGTR